MTTTNYYDRFQWFQCTRTKNNTTGNKPRQYSVSGFLWGRLELDSSNEQDALGGNRGMTRGTVRLRQWPAVTVEDRLIHTQFGREYLVTGVRQDREANETIVELESYDNYAQGDV